MKDNKKFVNLFNDRIKYRVQKVFSSLNKLFVPRDEKFSLPIDDTISFPILSLKL